MALQEQLSALRESGPRAVTFVSEAWSEMKKVTWPTRNETYAATSVVLIVTGIVALFLGLVDFILSYIVQGILS